MAWVALLVSLGMGRKLQDDMENSNTSSSATHCDLQAAGQSLRICVLCKRIPVCMFLNKDT